MLAWVKVASGGSGVAVSTRDANRGAGLGISRSSAVFTVDTSTPVLSGGTIIPDKWIQLVGTFTATSETNILGTVNYKGTANLYMDGAGVPGATNITNVTYIPAAKVLKVGRNADDSTPLTGYVDEVGLWSRALTEQEVSANFEMGKE